MGSLSLSLHGKNATLRGSSVTAKGPCRGPNCWVHDSSGSIIKTRGIRNDSNNELPRPPKQYFKLSFYCSSTLGCSHNRLNLLASNGPKITNRLLLSKPYGFSCGRNHNPNPLRTGRCNGPHDRSRTNVLSPLLFSKYQLRTDPQSNNTSHPRPSYGTTIS